MATVVFLRGVNVGGHRTFRPSTLAGQLKKYGVVNIGAAGTFVVREPVSQVRLRAEFLRHLPFEAHVIICSGRELLDIGSSNPFTAEPVTSDIVRFVSILAKRPRLLPSIPIALPPDGRWMVRIISAKGRFLCGLYRREMKVLGYLNAIDKLFGVPVTTRNWNTITAVAAVLKRE